MVGARHPVAARWSRRVAAVAAAAGLTLAGASVGPRAAELVAGEDGPSSSAGSAHRAPAAGAPGAIRPGVVLVGLEDGWRVSAAERASVTGSEWRGGPACAGSADRSDGLGSPGEGSGAPNAATAATAANTADATHAADTACEIAAASEVLGGVQVGERLADGVFAAVVAPGTEHRAALRLSTLPTVRFADVDHQVRSFELPDDPRYEEQWGMREIGMPEAWDGTRDASAVPVAVLDTGIKVDHPDLVESLWHNLDEVPDNGVDDDDNGFVDDVHGWRFYQDYSTGRAVSRNNADLTDNHGHGTHTAGIIGAVGDNGLGVTGVAWHARLMILRVMDDDGIGWESDIVRGLNYAVRNGALVANLSLGTEETGRALEAAVGRAEAAGVLVVAAAGNEGGPVSYPARDRRVLGVGATTTFARRASFSAFGEGLDVMAPGTSILSTWPEQPYHSAGGTSAAAPHVAGVAALMLARDPELTPALVRDCVRLVAQDLGEPGWDPLHGWGLLDAARSVEGCGTPLLLPRAEVYRPKGGVPLRP